MTPSLVWRKRNDCQCPSTYRDAIVFFEKKHVRTYVSLSRVCVCLGHFSCVPSSLAWSPGLARLGWAQISIIYSRRSKNSLRRPSIWKWNDFSICFSHFLMSTPLAHAMRKVAGQAAGRCCHQSSESGMDATFFLSRSCNPAAITATTTAHKTSRVVLLLSGFGWYNWTDARPRQRQQKAQLRRREKSFSCYLITGYNAGQHQSLEIKRHFLPLDNSSETINF